jgi:acetolactate synthase I/II/III large subunit
MKRTGASLARHALESVGVRWTFGIPGVHVTELYDALAESSTITPVLVTHEGCGSFAADAVSRVSDGRTLGALALVPAAGLTHAASGIGEAMLAGIPMLVITGGIRRDTGHRYQLHDIDQLQIATALTKKAVRVTRHDEVVPAIYESARVALSGEPGPVLVEIALDVLLFPGEVDAIPEWVAPQAPAFHDDEAIARAAELLASAKRPGIFVGWGARGAKDAVARIAELLEAPVATTLQGLAAFAHEHPLHAGFGFGRSAVPAARNAFEGCDGLLAIGTRFAEIATGSYGTEVPRQLVHVDINPSVFHANYRAQVALQGDATAVAEALLAALRERIASPRASGLAARIAGDKAAYVQSWFAHDSKGRVNPARFFGALRAQAPDDAVMVVDDGNHTYLTAELFPVHRRGRLIVPTDFNAMGYAVPAAVGARLAQPGCETFAIVGDGAFLMTGMEIVTAVSQKLGIVYFVFQDGELAQIAQAQRLPYRRTPCTTLGGLALEPFAAATGAAFLRIAGDTPLEEAIAGARALAATGRPVLVGVEIDYSRQTAFTLGAIQTNFRRFTLAQKARTITRMVRRSITG